MIHSGDRLENPVTGEVMIFRHTARETGGEAVLVETIVRPGGFVAAAHVHPHQTERFEVLDGRLGLQVGSQRRVARRGEVATVAPGNGAPVLERRRDRRPVPVRGAPGTGVRVADRDDVHACEAGQDEPQGDAESVPSGGDRALALRHRPPAVPAALLQRAALAVGASLGRLLGYQATAVAAA